MGQWIKECLLLGDSKVFIIDDIFKTIYHRYIGKQKEDDLEIRYVQLMEDIKRYYPTDNDDIGKRIEERSKQIIQEKQAMSANETRI